MAASGVAFEVDEFRMSKDGSLQGGKTLADLAASYTTNG
jgi:hypothetical protein